MNKREHIVSKKEKLSNLVLEGNLLKSLLIVSFPIIVFNIFKALFGNIDALFAVSSINKDVIGDFIQYSKSIQTIVDSIGACLGIAGITLIAREIGKSKDIYNPKARQIASSVFVLLIGVSILVALIMIILAEPFCNNIMGLKKYNILEEEINQSCIWAFRLKMLGVILLAINVFFLGTERILGKLKKILVLNCLMMTFKIGLSCLIYYTFNQKNPLGLEIASILSYACITIVAFITLLNQKNPFYLSIKDFCWKNFWENKKIIKNILKLALPLMLGKMFYEFGRLLTLWMIDSSKDEPFLFFQGFEKGTLSKIGAADAVISLFTQISFSLKEGQLMIVSENLGNKNIKRAIKTLIITSIFVFFVFVFTYLICAPNNYMGFGLGDKIYLFFKNLGKAENQITKKIPPGFSEFLIGGLLTTSLITTQLEIISTFLIAAKQPKYDLFLNFGRVYLFRIPFLCLFRNFFSIFQPGEKYEYHVYSTANFFSNCIMLIFMFCLCLRFIIKIKKEQKNIRIIN
ncbi:Na+-driven multidrug efflux pump [Candidatus Phytoplasma solani]|uniref:Na+-driven multidrug efflux pump n=1 Tax=Candidatus Phytoplasma solani TaxID=69896 RepID=UPI0003B7C84C|nr:Na+-driven multidrug efflux pump [Candidatus Phytoplasma solani]CCP88322.1 Na+-driven multidrug efflux pump [Candidatus Phytoplasma solani]